MFDSLFQSACYSIFYLKDEYISILVNKEENQMRFSCEKAAAVYLSHESYDCFSTFCREKSYSPSCGHKIYAASRSNFGG